MVIGVNRTITHFPFLLDPCYVPFKARLCRHSHRLCVVHMMMGEEVWC